MLRIPILVHLLLIFLLAFIISNFTFSLFLGIKLIGNDYKSSLTVTANIIKQYSTMLGNVLRASIDINSGNLQNNPVRHILL